MGSVVLIIMDTCLLSGLPQLVLRECVHALRSPSACIMPAQRAAVGAYSAFERQCGESATGAQSRIQRNLPRCLVLWWAILAPIAALEACRPLN